MACGEIIESLPCTRVRMLTISNDEAAIVETMGAGATGCRLKDTGPNELLEAVWEVATGGLNIPVATLLRALLAFRGGAQSMPFLKVDVHTSR